MASKRPRSNDSDTSDGEQDCGSKRHKHHDDERDLILWPPDAFDFTYLAWARQQFPTTGFCLDFRAQWLKTRHGCPLCDKYVVRRVGDIDRLCKDNEARAAVSKEFPMQLGTEKLENIEYTLCSKPHGAQSFAYSLQTKSCSTEVEVIFEGIVHLGWPEFSALLHEDQFSNLTVNLSKQSLTLKFVPKKQTSLDPEQAAMALVGYYLRLNRTAHAHKSSKRDAL